MSKAKPAKEKAPRPDKQATDALVDDCMAALAAQETVDTVPAGTQAAPSGKLKGFVRDLVKVLVKVGADGRFDASDVISIVTDIMARVNAKSREVPSDDRNHATPDGGMA